MRWRSNGSRRTGAILAAEREKPASRDRRWGYLNEPHLADARDRSNAPGVRARNNNIAIADQAFSKRFWAYEIRARVALALRATLETGLLPACCYPSVDFRFRSMDQSDIANGRR